MDTNIVLS